MRVVMQLIIMTFAMTLVACGGGGGGDNSTNGQGETSTKATWDSSNWDEKNWQ